VEGYHVIVVLAHGDQYPTMTPLITVMMAVFNAADFLDSAIKSIRTQSCSDFEFLIVDDGSTDTSSQIIKRNAEEDPRIIAHQLNHSGPAHARNLALGQARGQYVAQMDADDISTPNRFETQIEYLDAHKELAIVGSQVEFIDQYGKVIDRTLPLASKETLNDQLRNGTGFLCHSSAMFRRSALKRSGGYRAPFAPAEDHDLYLRIADFAELANVNSYLVKYRLHMRSLSFTRTMQQGLSMATAVEIAHLRRQGLAEPPLPEVSITWSTALAMGVDANKLIELILGQYCVYIGFALRMGEDRVLDRLVRELWSLPKTEAQKRQLSGILRPVMKHYATHYRPGRTLRYGLQRLYLRLK